MKTIIIDRPSATAKLKVLLKSIDSKIQIVGEANCYSQLSALFNAHNPDLMFVDSQLRKESSAQFEVPMGHKVIYTSESQPTKGNLEANNKIFVLKPYAPLEVERAIRLVNFSVPIKRFQDSPFSLQRLSVPCAYGLRIVDLTKIIRLESDNNYTRLMLHDGSEVLVTKTLKRFEEALPSRGFMRIHQRHIINFSHVQGYSKHMGGLVIMANQDEISLGKKYKKHFEERLNYRVLSV